MYSVEDISRILGREPSKSSAVAGEAGVTISLFSVDSRMVVTPEETLFFAIAGGNHNGHDYVAPLYSAGCRAFVVEEWREEFERLEGATIWRVESSVAALQSIAEARRAEYKGTVVGITGSNGKTIVKEWIYQAMSEEMNLYRSPRSYNSQIGVPLSLLSLPDDAEIALIEAGISKPGEMARLEKMIKPEWGIFTHLGDAHGENFESPEAKLREKLQLFKGCRFLIYRGDERLNMIISEELPEVKPISWGREGCDVVVEDESLTATGRRVMVRCNDEGMSFTIPFLDDASYENAMSVITFMLSMRIPSRRIAERISMLQPVAMRMEIKEGIGDSLLIQDYYNSDAASFRLALQMLASQDERRRRVVILSDFIDVGLEDRYLYENASQLLRDAGVSLFIGIGPKLSKYREFFDFSTNNTSETSPHNSANNHMGSNPGTAGSASHTSTNSPSTNNASTNNPTGGKPSTGNLTGGVPHTSTSRFYLTTEEFLKNEATESFAKCVILLKGARRYRFEKIAVHLQRQVHGTVLEVDMDAMIRNLNYFRSKVPSDTMFGVMVKAFTYGCGGAEIAYMLQNQGVDYLMVAFADEGVELREAGITAHIAVMNPEPDSFDNIISYGLEPEIFSLAMLKEFDEALGRHGLFDYPIHLKLNTGMNRSGIDERDLPELFALFGKRRNVVIRSIFSHLAAADEERHDEFTRGQVALFERMASEIENQFGYKIFRHILNSAGIERFPEYHFDMVRLGIGLHGISAVGAKLEPVASFKTHIAAIREVQREESVGYGRRGLLGRDSRIAVILVGYADGLNRHLGRGVGEMYVKGHRVPTVGNICMDSCMLDITDYPDIEVGDEVEIFGANIPATEVADRLGTIPYEIFTSVARRVRRIFLKE